MSFQIRFHGVPHSDAVRGDCEKLARELQQEFPDTTKIELSVGQTGELQETSLHVTGKEIDVAASAKAHDVGETIVEAFDRARRQLRKRHDKVIFSRRREGHRSSPK